MLELLQVALSLLHASSPSTSLLSSVLLLFGFLPSSFPFLLLFPLPESLGFFLFNFLFLIRYGGGGETEISRQIPLPSSRWRDHTVPWLWIVPGVFLSESRESVFIVEK